MRPGRAPGSAEMIAAKSGVGWLIFDSRLYLLTSRIFVGILKLGNMGLVTDRAFRLVAGDLLRKYNVRLYSSFRRSWCSCGQDCQDCQDCQVPHAPGRTTGACNGGLERPPDSHAGERVEAHYTAGDFHRGALDRRLVATPSLLHDLRHRAGDHSGHAHDTRGLEGRHPSPGERGAARQQLAGQGVDLVSVQLPRLMA
jgi:hypothetical protein